MVPVTALAHLTLQWIERPVRERANAIAKRETIHIRHLLPYVGALTTFVLVSTVVVRSQGFPARYGTLPGVDAASILAAASADSITAYDRRATRCRLADKGSATWCWRIAGEGRGVAVIGDSHAEVVFAGLAAQRDPSPLFLTGRNGCAPIVQREAIAERTAEICRRAALIAHEAVRDDSSISTVLMVSRGPAYITGTGFGVDSLRAVVPVTLGSTALDSLALQSAYAAGLERAVRSFVAAGKRVILVIGVPEIGFLPSECILGRPFGLRAVRSPCAVPRADFDQRTAGYHALVRAIALHNPHLELFDASPLFCDAAHCHAERQSRLLYQDGNHLTLAGSKVLAAALVNRLTSVSFVRVQE